jgi:hypothetical protein
MLAQVMRVFTDQNDSRNHHQRRAGMSEAPEKSHLQSPERRSGFRGMLFRMNGQDLRNNQ